MNTPVLVPVALAESNPTFRVIQAGWHQDLWYPAGAVIVASSGSPVFDGEPVILVAADRGRPRLGTVRGGRLFGDRGEPCSPVRWRVAGRAVAAEAERQLRLFAA